MSDPVSNAEIEDVLSSIRRLIAAGDPDQKDEAPKSEQPDNKLILTPAFRVFGGDPETATVDDAQSVPASRPSGRDIPVELLQQSDLSTAEAVEKVEDADDASPLILSFDTNIAEPGLHSTSDMEMPPADAQVDFEDNWDSDALGETAQVAFLHQRVTSVAANSPSEEAEPEAVIEDAVEPEIIVEEEVSATDDALEIEVTPELSSDQTTIEEAALEIGTLEIAEDDGDDVPEDDTEDQPILGDADLDDQTDEPIEGDHAAEVLVATLDDGPMAEIVEDDSDFIDEDHLQEIVSRIVREELKGEMGVKITQAVRRMVRREVTRALSLEKFD